MESRIKRFKAVGGIVAVLVLVSAIMACGGESSGPAGDLQSRASEGQLQAGASAVASQMQITIREVQDPYVSPDQSSRPSQGNRWVAYKVTIENQNNHEETAEAGSFKVIDADNNQHATEPIVFPELSLFKQTALLQPRSTMEGWIGFEVEEGVAVKELIYDPDPGTGDEHRFLAP